MSQCYHILAAKMTVGMEDKGSKRKINLTLLRRNTHPRNQKKSGRKAPRPGDYEINPAPDSITTQDMYYEISQESAARASPELFVDNIDDDEDTKYKHWVVVPLNLYYLF